MPPTYNEICAGLVGLFLASATVSVAAQAEPSPAAPADKHLLYELGVLMSGGLENFSLSEAEFAAVSAGLADGYHHRADIADALTYDPRLQALSRTRVDARTKLERTQGQTYLETAAATRGARKTASGLVYISSHEGSGATPKFNSAIRLNYQAKLVDGTIFDSSAARGAPATFQLTNVIPCFTEAFQFMRVGGTGRIICPADLAYGDRGSPPKVRPGATVEYDVELLAIVDTPAPGD